MKTILALTIVNYILSLIIRKTYSLWVTTWFEIFNVHSETNVWHLLRWQLLLWQTLMLNLDLIPNPNPNPGAAPGCLLGGGGGVGKMPCYCCASAQKVAERGELRLQFPPKKKFIIMGYGYYHHGHDWLLSWQAKKKNHRGATAPPPPGAAPARILIHLPWNKYILKWYPSLLLFVAGDNTAGAIVGSLQRHFDLNILPTLYLLFISYHILEEHHNFFLNYRCRYSFLDVHSFTIAITCLLNRCRSARTCTTRCPSCCCSRVLSVCWNMIMVRLRMIIECDIIIFTVNTGVLKWH